MVIIISVFLVMVLLEVHHQQREGLYRENRNIMNAIRIFDLISPTTVV